MKRAQIGAAGEETGSGVKVDGIAEARKMFPASAFLCAVQPLLGERSESRFISLA